MIYTITFNYGKKTRNQTLIRRYPSQAAAKRIFRTIKPNAHIVSIEPLKERNTLYVGEGVSYQKRKQRAQDPFFNHEINLNTFAVSFS